MLILVHQYIASVLIWVEVWGVPALPEASYQFPPLHHRPRLHGVPELRSSETTELAQRPHPCSVRSDALGSVRSFLFVWITVWICQSFWDRARHMPAMRISARPPERFGPPCSGRVGTPKPGLAHLAVDDHPSWAFQIIDNMLNLVG